MQLSRLVRNHRPRFNGNFPDLDLHCNGSFHIHPLMTGSGLHNCIVDIIWQFRTTSAIVGINDVETHYQLSQP